MTNTSKQLRLMKLHHESRDTELSDIYVSYSSAKYWAYRNCRDLYHQRNGYDFKIISYNKMMFTIGFYYKDDKGLLHFYYKSHITSLDFIVYNFTYVGNGFLW